MEGWYSKICPLTRCPALPSCWDLQFRFLRLWREMEGREIHMSRELCSVLGGLYRDLHFIEMKFKENQGTHTRLPSHWLAEPGFQSSPIESKVPELEARPRDTQLPTMPSAEPRWPHFDWTSDWNTPMSSDKENTRDHKKLDVRYRIWRFLAQYYIKNC